MPCFRDVECHFTAVDSPRPLVIQDTLGKVAKLLANDLAKAEEEYADHLANFRMYFKQLRTREEKFSQLKKNKDTLQGKIDSAEKKLSKMNPEHKDLATLTQKLSDLRSEMVSMDNAVISEDAAIGDYRRQTARSAVAHQVCFVLCGDWYLISLILMFITARRFMSTRRKDDHHRRVGQALDVRN